MFKTFLNFQQDLETEQLLQDVLISCWDYQYIWEIHVTFLK